MNLESESPRRSNNRANGREGPMSSKLIAVIIGEPLTGKGFGQLSYPFSPISPSSSLPYALLPICNTPLIDYILENLVENGVNEICLLLNPGSASKVRAHLAGCRVTCGELGTSGSATKVNILECSRDMQKLSDVVNEIRHRNLVPQCGSFLLMQIDCINIFSNNLQECFQQHLERARTINRYAATLLCTSSKANLKATLHNVLLQELIESRESGRNTASRSLLSEQGSLSMESDAIADYSRMRQHCVPSRPKEHHTMFLLDKATGVVQYMSRLEACDDEAPEPPLITFNQKSRLSVRMDLVPMKVLFCCCEALALVEFHIRDIYGFLSTSLLGQVEVFGNVFGVLEVPTRAAISTPVNNLETYIQANLDVCARRLSPLTRESSFAEVQAKYAVSSSCETVYLHTSAKALGLNNGPNVVVGEGVVVPTSVQLVGTVCGAHVVLGEATTLMSCVVMDGARIGKRCNLRGSVIGYNATICDDVELVNCIVDHNFILDNSLRVTNGAKNRDTASGSSNCGSITTPNICLYSQSIFFTKLSAGVLDHAPTHQKKADALSCSSVESTSTHTDNNDGSSVEDGGDDLSMRSSGEERVILNGHTNPIIRTAAFFTEDPIPKAAPSIEEQSTDQKDDEFELFRRSVKKHVDVALCKPSHIEASSYDMSTICLSQGHSYPELCEVVTELLVEHVIQTYGERGAEVAMEAARNLFAQWSRPFFNNFLSKNGQMNIDAMVATLEGLCAAICDPKAVLYAYGPLLVEILYNNCDDELYEKRGYCIVSGKGLVAFDSAMTRRRQNMHKYGGFEWRKRVGSSSSSARSSDSNSSDSYSRDSREEGKVIIAETCHEFIMGVKEFLHLSHETALAVPPTFQSSGARQQKTLHLNVGHGNEFGFACDSSSEESD